MYFDDLNWAAILVIAVLNIILGMLWYSPQVFGKTWMELMRFDESECEASYQHIIGGFCVALITATVLAIFVNFAEAFTMGEGMTVGFLAWLGFVATTHFSGVIWAKKPLKAYLIDSGYYLVYLLIAGAILGAWV